MKQISVLFLRYSKSILIGLISLLVLANVFQFALSLRQPRNYQDCVSKGGQRGTYPSSETYPLLPRFCQTSNGIIFNEPFWERQSQEKKTQIEDARVDLKEKVTKSKQKTGWLEVTGSRYQISFPEGWQFSGIDNPLDYFGQMIRLVSPSGNTELTISADYSFGLESGVQTSNITLDIGDRNYAGTEYQQGKQIFTLVEITDLVHKTTGNTYVVIFGNNYPTSLRNSGSNTLSQYQEDKEVVLEILKTLISVN